MNICFIGKYRYDIFMYIIQYVVKTAGHFLALVIDFHVSFFS